MSSNEIMVYINAGKVDIKDLTRLLDQKQISYSFSSDRTLAYTTADLYETKQRELRVPLITYKEAFDYALGISAIFAPIIYDLLKDWWKGRKKREKRKKKIKVKYRDQDGTVFDLTIEE